jgi:hypothetical protein
MNALKIAVKIVVKNGQTTAVTPAGITAPRAEAQKIETQTG